MAAVDADRNLLFGVLALQGDLIDANQFAEVCSAWALRKDRSIADHLLERGWLSAEDCRSVEQLLERKLKKHAGDAHQSLMVTAQRSAGILTSLRGLREALTNDDDVRQSLTDVGPRTPTGAAIDYLSPISRPSDSNERYTISSLHAKGGIGQVWLARDKALDRDVALKELRPDRSGDDALLRRFFQEAKITSQLDHPGVVPVYELAQGAADHDGDRPYYTMRFVRGRTLSQAVAAYHSDRAGGRDRRIDFLALIQAFVGVCNTVAFAHNRKVIHRDLKGQNIVLGEFGEVILLDWGLAKLIDRDGVQDEPEPEVDPAMTTDLPGRDVRADADLTAAGQVLGTPAYMAPEQAHGRADQIGRRTDVYGLGMILYEILAGQPPFEGDSTWDVLRKVREELPAPPRKLNRSAPKPLEAICLKAIAKDAALRYGLATELAADVQHWLADEPVSAWREPWTMRARRWVVRHRTQVAAGIAALAMAVMGLSAAVVIQSRANRDLKLSLQAENLARADAKAQSRQAEEAIETFYRGISEDVILRRPELKELRASLLGTALRFYEKRVQYLTDKHQGNRQLVQYIVYGLDHIASLQGMIGDRKSAIQTRLRMVELCDANPQLAPDRSADARLSLGELERLAGRPDEAARSLRQALKQFEAINYEAKVALVQTDLGRLLFDMGKSDEARPLLDRARELQEKLAAAGGLATNLADTYTTLANLHEAEGRPQEALGFYEKAKDMYEKFAAPRRSTYFQAELARSLNNLGLARAKAGKPAEGRRDIERGKTIREQLLTGQPLNIDPRSDLARSYFHLAQVDVLAGAPAQALASIRRAEELYAGIPPKGPEDIYFQACMKAMHAGLVGGGKADQELSTADRAERTRDADLAVNLLKQAALAGYANPSRFKTTKSLDPLRPRPDFQELMRSIDRPSDSERKASSAANSRS